MDEDEIDEGSVFGSKLNVVIVRNADGCTTPVTGTTPIVLSDPKEPMGNLLTELIDSTVQLTAGEGIPEYALAVLRKIQVPAAFAASPWLSHSRPLVIMNGTMRVAGLSLSYSEDAGLVIDSSNHDERDERWTST